MFIMDIPQEITGTASPAFQYTGGKHSENVLSFLYFCNAYIKIGMT